MTVSRRDVLKSLGGGFGTLALAGVMSDARLLAAEPGTAASRHGHTLAPRDGHFPAKARAIIQLFQNGGPSQMDLFDNKRELSKRNGQPHPEQVETFQLIACGIRIHAIPSLKKGRVGFPYPACSIVPAHALYRSQPSVSELDCCDGVSLIDRRKSNGKTISVDSTHWRIR